MSDRFEDFMRDHREDFDLHEPDPKLWEGIQKNIKPSQGLRWKFYLSRAAVVVFIFITSFAVQRIWMKSDNKIAIVKEKNTNTEIPELKEAELYYSGLMHAKLKEVEPLLS